MIMAMLLGAHSLFANDDYFKAKEHFEPYEVGVPKKIDIYGGLIIHYKNEYIDSKTAQIHGTIEVDIKYKIEKLEMNYYIIGKDKKTIRVASLPLMKGAYPNTFSFEHEYPLDLKAYEYEIFSMLVLIEKVESANEI
jgi:hypothetical protein